MLTRERTYALLGAVLAIAAPLGLLILKAAVLGEWPSVEFVVHQIREQTLVYAYITVVPLMLFLILGWLVGTQEMRLRRRSNTDALTGLSNRRYFDERLQSELARCARYNTPLSLLIIDLDHLKQINDERGHVAGDAALIAVAEALRQSSRATDVNARYGGDEFAILAVNTRGGEAAELAERVRERVSTLEVNSVQQPVSVSIGVCDVATLGEPDADRLFNAADIALYDAKDRGRNRVAVATKDQVSRMT